MPFVNLSQASIVRFSKKGIHSTCPVCDRTAGGCSYRLNGDLFDLIYCNDETANPVGFICRGDTNAPGWTRTTLWVPSEELRSGDTPAAPKTVEELQRRAELRNQQAIAAAERKAGNPDGNLRHTEYTKLLSILPETLHPQDLADLTRRGITPEQARSMGIRSIGVHQPLKAAINASIPGISSDGRSMSNSVAGYIVPIKDPSGRILGAQIKNRAIAPIEVPGAKQKFAKYLWLSSDDGDRGYGPSLACGEVPLAYAVPEEQSIELSDYVGLCEGTGVKVALIADRFGIPTIGASGGNFGKSDNDFYLLNAYYKASGRKHLMLIPDAGAIFNTDVVLQYSRVAEFVEWKNTLAKKAVALEKSIGGKTAKHQPIELKVQWWDQFTKASPDGDELTGEKTIVLTWKQFFSCTLGSDRRYASAWIDSRRFTPDEVRNARYCDFPMPEKREMLCIKAALGLGKTERLIQVILQAGWGTIVFAPTNNLCINFNERAAAAGIRGEMMGQMVGLPQAAKEAAQLIELVSLCPDSILNIDLDKTAGKLIAIDEAHATRIAFTQRNTHIKNIRREAIDHLQAMLTIAGGVILMDGNLTDHDCQYFAELCPSLNVRKIEYSHRTPMKFEIDLGTKEQYLGRVKHQSKVTQVPIIMGSDSALDTSIAPYNLEKKTIQEGILEPDGKLTANWTDLALKDPMAFVQKYLPIFLAFSPAVGAGWNCQVKDYFKEFYLFGSGVLGVDDMLQMAARDRNTGTVRQTWIAEYGHSEYWNIDKKSCLPAEIAEAYARNHAEMGALMGAPTSRAFQVRSAYVNDFIQNDPTAKMVMMQAAFSNFEQYGRIRGGFIYALIAGGHSVSLVMPIDEEELKEAAKEHKDAKSEIKTTEALEEKAAPLIDRKQAQVFKNASRVAPGVRAQLNRRSLEDMLPGIANQPIWNDDSVDEKTGKVASIEFIKRAPKIARRATEFFFLSNPAIAKRKAQGRWNALLNSKWIDITTLDIKYVRTKKVRDVLLKKVKNFVGLELSTENAESLAVNGLEAFKNLDVSYINRKEIRSIVEALKTGSNPIDLKGKTYAHKLKAELTPLGFDCEILKKADGIGAIGDLKVTAPFLTAGTVENQCYQCVCDRFIPKADEPAEMVWTLDDAPIATPESLELSDEFTAVSEGLTVDISPEGWECSVEFEEDYEYSIECEGEILA